MMKSKGNPAWYFFSGPFWGGLTSYVFCMMCVLKEAVAEGEEFNTSWYYLGMQLTLKVKQKLVCCFTSYKVR